MSLISLPPVRRAVSLHRVGADRGRRLFGEAFPGHHVHLVSSGTAALALALLDARRRHGASRAEAIIPAYGCPQLVSACLYASVRPRVVDTARDSAGRDCWGYDPERLRAALSPDTVAIVAVNLLGVGDQVAEMLPLAREAGACLIQDSAQHLASVNESDWRGDYVILSFGRGKPLNLLRGGALLVPAGGEFAAPLLQNGASMRETLMGSRGAAVAFNAATHPFLYGLISRLPGLGVGATTYDEFSRLTALPSSAWGQAGPALVEYLQEVPSSPWTAEVIAECERFGFSLLPCASSTQSLGTRRLRLALLADTAERRDAVLLALTRQGLGASNMYAVSIDRVSGVPEEITRQGPFPNATSLANRLLTLPTHSWVTERAVQQTLACMRALR